MKFDVIVVGGGHAGCEAALASARIGVSTLLITQHRHLLASMPCNPSIGGIAKSHLVVELDSMGGEIARNADYTGVHFRVLNTRHGPAVQANRVQCDKIRYSERMQYVISTTTGLSVIESRVIGIHIDSGGVAGVETEDHTIIRSKCVVLTPGTAMGGTIHIGSRSSPGGGNGGNSAPELGQQLRKLGFRTERLKTGTPARLLNASLDYARMEVQPGQYPAPFLSWEGRGSPRLFHVEQNNASDGLRRMFHVEHQNLTSTPWIPGRNQMPCYVTATTARTHDIVRDNLNKSSLYGGFITGTGVRYCPSLEDKVVKFPDKESHHVFIEPEGRNTDLVYPNGISNSLPAEVQLSLVHSIPGLERAVISQYAYAIEYDFVEPTQLSLTLESRTIESLFMAGQINGTTGYEEAAAQGFVAGVNAARKSLGIGCVTIRRSDAYIGVMIDDLTTKGVTEPYRMFTSRSEYRLRMRQDNARFRLFDMARLIGIVQTEYTDETELFQQQINEELQRLKSAFAGGASMIQILRRPDVRYSDLPGHRTELADEVVRQVEIMAKYEGYIDQEDKLIERTRQVEMISIPDDFDYSSVRSLRHEAREKFIQRRPQNLFQASSIPGITPADISILAVLIKSKGMKRPSPVLRCPSPSS